ncbi:Retrovirus-related Pol polyprotein from transposon TNT 1-94 [Symbiodinium microadriaticum]|uniref:Retrovirus-related Pol polyprotein from transposon TNT 1-94 n=1 Tax=Symbiodinium microadriaticum TaxID=2951 RepID=A0A1Q9C3E2_SYMMI|nr:Retrovirus-related Pol polyprotein from transposon TNT 1-94 [Symbiodinium microadriaticum]
MLEISAPPASSSVRPLLNFPMADKKEPKEEYVEVVVEAKPTPPKVAPKGRGSQKGSVGKQSVGKIKGKGPKAAASGKLDSNMPKIKAQPKPPQVKAAPKRPSAPASSSKGPGTKAGAVNLVPKGVRKMHLKPRPDSLKSNPPLGRRWSAYPRKRKGKQQGKQQKATAESSTQTPEIMTVMGHAERHEKLEEEAKSFAQLLERHGSAQQYEARFPQVDLSIAAGRAEVTTRAMVEITDKTSYTSPSPAPRQHPPPPPPPDVTMEPAGTVPGSPSSFSLVTAPEAPKTPDAGKDGGTTGQGDGYGIGFGTYVSSSHQIGSADSQGVLPGSQGVLPGRPRNEIQADKFWFRGVAMLVLVAVGVGMLGTLLWQPDRESMVSSFVRWSRSAGLAGSGEVTVSMRSDGEPALVSFLERCCRELPSASLEQVPVDRHAPNAERAIRTLKELAQVDAMRALPLPNTNTRGPPKEWIAEHGKTPRYAKFLRESFSPEATVAQDRELDQELGFDPAVRDLGDLGFEGLGDYVELPRDVLPDGSGTYDNDPLYEPDLTDEEGQLPAHPAGEITNEEAADLMDVDPEPLDRIPEGVAMAFAERFEHHEAIGQVAAPVQEGDKGGEIIVELGGGLVKVQRPCASRDDVTEVSLDLGLTYEGMIKELKALESLSVGDMMWTIDPKQRVISTRWVVAAKNERIDGKETPIGCRIVARDYSTGPSASQLGISSPTASGEALKLFLAAIGAEGFNILGLDVSTAFLFAWLGDEKVVVSMPEGCVGPGGEKLYLRTGASTEDLYEMVELLRKELKLKVTADLAKDGKIHFLGREILRSEPGGDLKFGMDPGYMQDVLEEYKLENAKGLPTPPCLRDLLDKSLDEASLQVPLTPEAAARYRRALGKLSWLSATRGDLVYYISVLARGQSSPLEVHERAMRAVLRYLKTVVHYFQVFPRQRHSHMLLRAYVDASWGSERSVERRSISGGCLMLGKACIKSWARLQQSVALSSAESELYALVEGSREALGARCAVGHILGHEGEIVPHIYCDSEAAVNISKMEGLRKLRHIDIRACFIQTEVQAGAIKVFSVKGTENPADIFTKYGTEYQKHLDGLWAVHRKLWVVVKTMSNLSDHWAVEWPARCAYWKQTESFFERLSYPVYTSYVDGCAAGLLGNDGLPIAKRWRVMEHSWDIKFVAPSIYEPRGGAVSRGGCPSGSDAARHTGVIWA